MNACNYVQLQLPVLRISASNTKPLFSISFQVHVNRSDARKEHTHNFFPTVVHPDLNAMLIICNKHSNYGSSVGTQDITWGKCTSTKHKHFFYTCIYSTLHTYYATHSCSIGRSNSSHATGPDPKIIVARKVKDSTRGSITTLKTTKENRLPRGSSPLALILAFNRKGYRFPNCGLRLSGDSWTDQVKKKYNFKFVF